jgi:hypothetical protein
VARRSAFGDRGGTCTPAAMAAAPPIRS